jgi:DNA-binding response OmpR family regulator
MLRGQQIVIIEDEPVIALDLKLALAEAGADVIGVAATLKDALRLAEAPGLTGAIVDLRLQDGSAREVARRLTERGIPFLFYSGLDDSPTARSWPKAPLLTKPQSPAAVVDMLARIILPERMGG